MSLFIVGNQYMYGHNVHICLCINSYIGCINPPVGIVHPSEKDVPKVDSSMKVIHAKKHDNDKM